MQLFHAGLKTACCLTLQANPPLCTHPLLRPILLAVLEKWSSPLLLSSSLLPWWNVRWTWSPLMSESTGSNWLLPLASGTRMTCSVTAVGRRPVRCCWLSGGTNRKRKCLPHTVSVPEGNWSSNCSLTAYIVKLQLRLTPEHQLCKQTRALIYIRGLREL